MSTLNTIKALSSSNSSVIIISSSDIRDARRMISVIISRHYLIICCCIYAKCSMVRTILGAVVSCLLKYAEKQ